ncbi:unnamed protein product [Enterobius vermicularis]|uniref:Secreted protein n=1 Tax=Enterobius vermicularis TaxID=51028 RepID=A0A0N4UY85_ENTVE|nr:unnamed protein product [Enterobius vermicularis]
MKGAILTFITTIHTPPAVAVRGKTEKHRLLPTLLVAVVRTMIVESTNHNGTTSSATDEEGEIEERYMGNRGRKERREADEERKRRQKVDNQQ